MKVPAALLFGALLASPAWSEGPTFDLRSEQVRNILRSTAATQFGAAEPVQEVKPARRPFSDAVVVKPDDSRLEKPAKPPRHRVLQTSVLLDSILAMLLGTDDNFEQIARYTYIKLCEQPDRPTLQRYQSCPGVSP